jgi:hypothetical protein
MNRFAAAAKNQTARTTNNMKARKNTGNAVVDLFYKIGAMRGQNVIPDFVAAYTENKDLALRVVAWARDARQGAGERKIYRDILNYLEQNDPNAARALASKAPELGRWDDLLALQTGEMRTWAFGLISEALHKGDGLAAKWMPRQGADAVQLRSFMGLTPKRYRKMLVNLTNVVEQQMCAKNWNEINFSHVPSLASSRYRKAFFKNAKERFEGYVAALKRGDKGVKVNAATVYPYDLTKSLWGNRYGSYNSATEHDHIIAQWDALPNYIGDAKALAIVDCSGSMSSPVSSGKGQNITAFDVAMSLGLYVADKNVGPFKDMMINFSSNSELKVVTGNIVQKCQQLHNDCWSWGGSTNLHSAFENILKVAKQHDVPAEDMPSMLLIMSDMQFNQCVQYDDSAMGMIRRKYENAGYKVPQIVFWNIKAYDNAPAKFNENGIALVSGFSPAIMKGVLANSMDSFTPEATMLKTIMDDRYKVL